MPLTSEQMYQIFKEEMDGTPFKTPGSAADELRKKIDPEHLDMARKGWEIQYVMDANKPSGEVFNVDHPKKAELMESLRNGEG